MFTGLSLLFLCKLCSNRIWLQLPTAFLKSFSALGFNVSITMTVDIIYFYISFVIDYITLIHNIYLKAIYIDFRLGFFLTRFFFHSADIPLVVSSVVRRASVICLRQWQQNVCFRYLSIYLFYVFAVWNLRLDWPYTRVHKL